MEPRIRNRLGGIEVDGTEVEIHWDRDFFYKNLKKLGNRDPLEFDGFKDPRPTQTQFNSKNPRPVCLFT